MLQTIGAYLTQLPVYLVWIGGMLMAVVNWRRNPRAAQLTLVALFIFFMTSIGGTAISTWLPLTLHARGMAAQQMGIVSAIINTIRAIFNALAFGILFAVIFSWQGESRGAEETTQDGHAR